MHGPSIHLSCLLSIRAVFRQAAVARLAGRTARAVQEPVAQAAPPLPSPLAAVAEGAAAWLERTDGARAPSALVPSVTMDNLPGIVPGHFTYGKGIAYQINYDLAHVSRTNPRLCLESCRRGKTSKRPHLSSCEHGIILAAKKQRAKYKV